MNKRLAGLIAVAAVLGGYAAFEAIKPSTPDPDVAVPAAETTAARSADVKVNPLEGLDPQSFTAIIERPLFNPSRQPRPPAPVVTPEPVVEQPPVEEPPPPPPQGPGPEDYKLLGVASGPVGRVAAVRVAASGEVVYLRKGDSLDSWSVIDVADRSVAIGTPETSVTYSLFATTDEGGQPPEGDDGSMMPPQGQGQPLPLPLPMPQPQQQPANPQIPEQHTVPGSGG